MNKDVCIIGAGPSGIAAAIQLKRYNISPIILEMNRIGGLLNNANLIENYPGFPDGISGEKLCMLFNEQFNKCNINIINEEVMQLDFVDNEFIIKTSNSVFISKYLILASGTKHRVFTDIKISDKAAAYIFYEIVEAKKFLNPAENNTVGIIGAGDAAFDYALSLCSSNKVFILNRSSTIKCLPVLKKQVDKTSSIKYKDNVKIKSIKPADDGIIIETNNSILFFNVLIFAIGREANTGLLENKNWYSKDEKSDRLFLIGDVKNELHRQTGIAVGNGINAAMTIYENIRKINNAD